MNSAFDNNNNNNNNNYNKNNSYREDSKKGLAKLQSKLLDPIVEYIDEFLKIRLLPTTGKSLKKVAKNTEITSISDFYAKRYVQFHHSRIGYQKTTKLP